MARAATTSDVFNAIAEPRRREIVDLLAMGAERDVTELVFKLGFSQSAVSKHLSVLRKVGVVAVHKAGQRRVYRLNPQELKPVHDWIQNFEHLWTDHLASIKEAAERKRRNLPRTIALHRNSIQGAKVMSDEEIKTLNIVKEVRIAAPAEVVFQTVLEPHGPLKELKMKLEAWPGGRWFRDLGNNTGHLWGHVQVIKPPKLLELVGPTIMSYPAISHIQYRLTEQADGTLLKFTHRAIGLIEPGLEQDIRKGWGEMLDQIRSAAEKKRG